MRAFITGGSGFLGKNLVSALLSRGDQVHTLSRSRIDSEMNQHPQLFYYQGGFTDNLETIIRNSKSDTLFHLACSLRPKESNDQPVADIEENIAGSVRLFLSAVNAGIKNIIFISSGGTVYGPTDCPLINEAHPTNPISSYGIAKLSIEKYLSFICDQYRVNATCLRLSNPYGEHQDVFGNQGAVSIFLKKAVLSQAVEVWGDGSIIRDYVYVSDVIKAMLNVADRQLSGRLIGGNMFNIGSGQGHSLNQVLSQIELLIGRPVQRNYFNSRSFDVENNILCIKKAAEEINWFPEVSFSEGLKKLHFSLSEAHK